MSHMIKSREENPAPRLWYVRRDYTVLGPFPTATVHDFVIIGRLQLDDDVSPDSRQWRTLSEVEELVPSLLREPESEERERRLLEARMRADERLRDRRGNLKPASDDRRSGAERRGEEPPELLTYRELRRRVSDGYLEHHSSFWPMVLLAILLLLLLGAGFYFYLVRGTQVAARGPDCSLAAAPGVNWSNCGKESARLARVDLRGARLTSTRLAGASLQQADLRAADAAYADFSGATLRRADLRGGRFLGAAFRNSDLTEARLDEADLRFADLRGATLSDVSADGVLLDRAIWVDGRVCAKGSTGRCRAGDAP